MDLSYEERTFAKIGTDVTITGQSAIGHHQLIFTFKLNVHPREQAKQVDVLDLRGELLMDSRHVGQLRSHGARRVRHRRGVPTTSHRGFVLTSIPGGWTRLPVEESN